jgi:CRP/FNR family transcriptional regulator
MYSTTLAEVAVRAPGAAHMGGNQQRVGAMRTSGEQRSPAQASAWLETDREPTAKAAAAPERHDCAHCASRRFCMPDGFDAKQAAELKGVFGNYRKVKQGEAVFRAGETFRNLYVVKGGSYKTVAIDNEGREQIIGFQIAGEFMGLDGISTGHHAFDAIALEDSVVCSLPFNELTATAERNLGMRNHLHRLLSREVVRESALLMLMGRMTAIERLVAFLLNLSKRYAQRGYSAQEFNLRMTRDEIGCHLGLTLETVSRSLSKLNSLGLIKCTGKQVSIKDSAGLELLAGHSIPQ